MKSSYYEIIRFPRDLHIRCFPCNVMMNRAHWHSALEIMACMKGSFSMRIGDTEYHLSEGDLITVDSGIIHEIFDGKPGGQQLIFEIDEKWIRRLGNYSIDFRTVGENSQIKSHPDVKNVISKLYSIALRIMANMQSYESVNGVSSNAAEIAPKTRYRVMSDAYNILEILHDYIRYENNAVNKYPSEPLRQCIEIVQSEYSSDISPESVASRIGLSVPSFHRMLKAQLGVSFLKYLNSIRISAAEALLLDENINIIDIPEQCGFPSESNFYRVFKEYTGCSPKQYRENKKGATFNVLRPAVLMLNNFENVSIDQVSIDRLSTERFE